MKSPPTPYELLHRIAERRGAKVRLYLDEALPLERALLLVVDQGAKADETTLAMWAVAGRTLDEAALSCLRQMKAKV